MLTGLWNTYHHDEFLKCYSANPSAQLRLERQKDIIQDNMKMDNSAMETQEQVENGEEVLDAENNRSVQNTVFDIINNQF